jgi:hypothetical protein
MNHGYNTRKRPRAFPFVEVDSCESRGVRFTPLPRGPLVPGDDDFRMTGEWVKRGRGDVGGGARRSRNEGKDMDDDGTVTTVVGVNTSHGQFNEDTHEFTFDVEGINIRRVTEIHLASLILPTTNLVINSSNDSVTISEMDTSVNDSSVLTYIARASHGNYTVSELITELNLVTNTHNMIVRPTLDAVNVGDFVGGWAGVPKKLQNTYVWTYDTVSGRVALSVTNGSPIPFILHFSYECEKIHDSVATEFNKISSLVTPSYLSDEGTCAITRTELEGEEDAGASKLVRLHVTHKSRRIPSIMLGCVGRLVAPRNIAGNPPASGETHLLNDWNKYYTDTDYANDEDAGSFVVNVDSTMADALAQASADNPATFIPVPEMNTRLASQLGFDSTSPFFRGPGTGFLTGTVMGAAPVHVQSVTVKSGTELYVRTVEPHGIPPYLTATFEFYTLFSDTVDNTTATATWVDSTTFSYTPAAMPSDVSVVQKRVVQDKSDVRFPFVQVAGSRINLMRDKENAYLTLRTNNQDFSHGNIFLSNKEGTAGPFLAEIDLSQSTATGVFATYHKSEAAFSQQAVVVPGTHYKVSGGSTFRQPWIDSKVHKLSIGLRDCNNLPYMMNSKFFSATLVFKSLPE